MISLLAALALAQPPADFVEMRREADCVLYKGPAEADGTEPMVAECHWKEVDPARLIARLQDFASYGTLIPGVVSSVVVRREEPRALVHQVQATKGIAPREVLIWMVSEPLDGGARVAWTTAAAEALAVPEDHVRAERNDGAWEVTAHPDGGAAVVHRIAYDPGGSVPGWLVRWFQVGGMMGVMTHVREVARS